MTAQEFELDSIRHEDIRVRVFGDCAVVHAITVVKGRFRGADAGGRYRYIRVWARRAGKWQAVAGQSTTIVPLPRKP
jgi:ketosteroid isomerase-like protein